VSDLDLRLVRDVTQNECPWLDMDRRTGTVVYRCTKATYGAISWTGIACTDDPHGGYPFFELPANAVEAVAEAPR
jgi:hypothetical protein